MNSKSKLNKLILKSAYIIIIVLIIAVIALIILKYNVEGEKNMPFKLSSIILISSAEGYQKEETDQYIWNTEIYQTNDIYLNIQRNKNYKKNEVITSIAVENIKINEKPIIGDVKFYRAAKQTENIFEYKEEYEINNNIEYFGDINTDLSNLKISNQGGTIIIRVVNQTGKKYSSNEKEFEHSGKLLNKIGISSEDIQCIISFDLVMKLESNISFRANIEVELPTGNIENEGTSSTEIKDLKNIIFKREQI